MKRVATHRFAIVKNGRQYVKPFLDYSPYLFYKTKRDALKACLSFDGLNEYKIIRVKITIEPSRSL